jgi:DNA-binding CsgD family transcriptional regulator
MKNDELKVQPLDFDDFAKKSITKGKSHKKYLSLLKSTLDEMPNYAIAPYFWFIAVNTDMTIVDSSDNIHELTPFKKGECKEYFPNFLKHIMPESDYKYFLGCTSTMLEFFHKKSAIDRSKYKFSIYCRVEDQNKKLRWMLVQFPKIFFNEEGRGVSSIIMFTDLDSFNNISKSRMTILNTSNAKQPYHLAIPEQNTIEKLNFPKISKREREILGCTIKGLTTPQIAEKLYISYHTVENHKRNLRKKTNSKTTAELVYYVLQNQLM